MVRKAKAAEPQPSALERLRELEQAIAASQRAEREAEGKLRQRVRRRDSAAGALRAYYTGLGEGDPPDEARERQLREELRELEGRLVQEYVNRPNGHRELAWVDPEAEGRLDGARAAVQNATSAVAAFVVQHRDELQAELLEQSLAARDRLLEAIDELAAAESAWTATARRWRDLGQHWAVAPAEVPMSPVPGEAMQDLVLLTAQTRGGARDARGAVPAPVRLAPGSSGEVEYAADLPGWARAPRVVSSAGGLMGA